ncbi:cysteine-rich receptor-like protein kinase 42 [Impatiens glandulifera]|uniref:cysteine-rich receptor-like protein kinase 42 n=1 Tax=Impatiens glandulifera TaxID=253017 RepID=UPI001FB06468|nr:cysteine-rich receptor-like protein kinase 42 [Impatiens glandulifera]
MAFQRKHQIPNSSISLFLTLILFLFNSTLPVHSNPRIEESGLFCGNSTPLPNSSFIPTFVKDMEVLSQIISNNHHAHFISNSSSNFSIYGLGQCHHDLTHTDCLLCFAVCRTRLPHCLPSSSARIFLDGCFLRYDNYNFFNESTDPVNDRVNCTDSISLKVETLSVHQLFDNLTELAVGNGGFGVGEIKGVFGLAQCWETLSSEGCRECLFKAAKELKHCLPRNEGRGMNAGCYLRYSTTKFYNQVPHSHPLRGISGKVEMIIGLASIAFLMLTFFAGYAFYLRWSRFSKGNSSFHVSNSFNKMGLNFKYEVLEKATDYFNPLMKIGEGGAGCVFKGKLPNGEIVAIKRLFFSSRQWVDEFFNEVNLVRGMKHKNLVKLLGCSIEGPESLLVYEYLPNSSLDHSLFDDEEKDSLGLKWEDRLKIIVGTAEGLNYLHCGTETRIIHRDIKSSNILLDEDLNPKIADFGLARCFAPDKSHLSTGIAGTLGYMAPEYLVRGQLTEKADVYSFGVLVLEIICCRKNNSIINGSGSLVQTVWKLYMGKRLVECIDSRLKDSYSVREIERVLQIGLLCTQASVSSRPSMAEVVEMLSVVEGDGEIPEPNQPPFMNSGSINSLASRPLTSSIEASSSSSSGITLISS